MGAGLIRIILTGLDFDVLLPITDITGRQAYFSLITSNSYGLHRLATPELYVYAYVSTYMCEPSCAVRVCVYLLCRIKKKLRGPIYYMSVCVCLISSKKKCAVLMCTFIPEPAVTQHVCVCARVVF